MYMVPHHVISQLLPFSIRLSALGLRMLFCLRNVVMSDTQVVAGNVGVMLKASLLASQRNSHSGPSISSNQPQQPPQQQQYGPLGSSSDNATSLIDH
jgi:hypothetical protein